MAAVSLSGDVNSAKNLGALVSSMESIEKEMAKESMKEAPNQEKMFKLENDLKNQYRTFSMLQNIKEMFHKMADQIIQRIGQIAR